MRTFEKQPWERFDYDVEMEDWFDERDDEDQIKSIGVTSVPPFGADPELELGPGNLPATQFLPGRGGLLRRGKIWIGAGTDGVDYIVTAKIETELGRRDEIEFKLKVREKP